MFSESISLLDGLFISISSILVVFSVLFILFIAVKIFGKVFHRNDSLNKAGEKNSDEDENIIAVLMAAIKAYEEGKRVNPMVRITPRRIKAGIVSANRMSRDCYYAEDIEQVK